MLEGPASWWVRLSEEFPRQLHSRRALEGAVQSRYRVATWSRLHPYPRRKGMRAVVAGYFPLLTNAARRRPDRHSQVPATYLISLTQLLPPIACSASFSTGSRASSLEPSTSTIYKLSLAALISIILPSTYTATVSFCHAEELTRLGTFLRDSLPTHIVCNSIQYMLTRLGCTYPKKKTETGMAPSRRYI